MAWTLLIIYLVISELVFFGWIVFSILYCEENVFSCVRQELSPLQKYACLLLTGVFMLVAAPIVLPFMIYEFIVCYRREKREAEKLFRTYKEILLEPLHPGNIPDDLLEYLEEHTPIAIEMGFLELGDYWLKEEPYHSKARIFLHPDNLGIAEIGVTLQTLYCEITSFLEDGQMISTPICEPFSKVDAFAKHGVHVNAVRGADFREMVESHLEFMDQISQSCNTPVQKISHSKWKDFYWYHNHKFGTARYELGEIEKPPEFCQFPVEREIRATILTG